MRLIALFAVVMMVGAGGNAAAQTYSTPAGVPTPNQEGRGNNIIGIVQSVNPDTNTITITDVRSTPFIFSFTANTQLLAETGRTLRASEIAVGQWVIITYTGSLGKPNVTQVMVQSLQ